MAMNRPDSIARGSGSRMLQRLLCEAERIDLEPFACDIARVRDDRIPFLKAATYLKAVAVVAANLDLLEM
jgi:hypothetical protein